MSYSPFRHIGSVFWKHNPIHLTLFLTRRCNAKCPFCFYLSDKEASRAIASELSLEEIKKISSSMGKLLWLALSGGEIFLRKDLVEIVKIFYEQNKPAIILLPTNGLLPKVIKDRTEAILKHCSNSVVTVKLSLDGPEPIHDSTRGVKGSFSKTMETYKAIKGLLDVYPNFELGINTVFCSMNQDYVDGVIESVSKMNGIKTHTISLIRGEVEDETLKEVDTGKYLKTIKKLEANQKNKTASMYRFKGARLKAAQDLLQRRLIHKTVTENRQIIPCYAGRLNLVLTESGDLYPCESFIPSMKLGNVRKDGYDMKKILKSEQAQKVIRSIRDDRCYCTHECYFMTNILFNPSTYPALLKEYVQI